MNYLLGSRRQLAEPWQATLRSPHGFEGVKWRNTWATFLEVETGIGEDEVSPRRSDSEPQREALPQYATVVGEERIVDTGARTIEKDRIFADLSRKELLGEPWNTDHIEGEATRSFGCGDEDPSWSALRRGNGNLEKTASEN
jgi:hypothetical protein